MAMCERMGKTNRDIYDAWFFLKNNWPINKRIVEERAKMAFKKVLSECIEKLEKLPERSILAGMGELLDENQKSWAKAKLKKDILFLLKLKLENEK